MQIEVNIPRPYLVLGILAAIGWGAYMYHSGFTEGQAQTANVTGTSSAAVATADGPDNFSVSSAGYADDIRGATGGDVQQEQVRQAEESVRQGQEEQEVLKHKADILRGQIRMLEAEQKAMGDQVSPTLQLQFENAAQILRALLQDQRRADDFLLASLHQLWEAQDKAIALGRQSEEGEMITLAWPVKPQLGISAVFRDAGYKQRFGFEHDAVDIPVPQGTPVLAAAEGTVEDVVDHGLGFSYITVRHANGVVTMYGHLTEFRVRAGMEVKAGDVLGLSGGRPGTPGAGLSTGPHLHFAVFHGGMGVDPMLSLPPLSSFVTEGK